MLMRFLVLLVAVGITTGAATAQDADCAPVALGSATIRCEIPLAADTLLYLENQGVDRLLVILNGHAFKLAADSAEVAQSANAFPMPRHGALTIHIGAYMRSEANTIEFTPQGPSGSTIPRVVIANVLLEGQTVAYAIEGLQPVPQQLALLQSYPNPFLVSTTLAYTIPEDRTTGLQVHLAVYDAVGRLVRVLVDERRYPGTFRTVWDGTLADGRPAPSGLYLGRLVAGELRNSVRITRIR